MGAAEAAGTIRVLLADDDAPFLEALLPLIERQPELAVVGTAHDGLAAIELADELSPDAVVIDLHMPRLDGVSAVTRLRHDHPSMCVIALTADEHRAIHDLDSLEALARALGKPVPPRGEIKARS